jgi:hypothetical protein
LDFKFKFLISTPARRSSGQNPCPAHPRFFSSFFFPSCEDSTVFGIAVTVMVVI